MFQENNNVNEIAKKLSANNFYVQISIQNGKKLNKKILNILDDIYMIDYKVKLGIINISLALELFIINFVNRYFN